MIFFASLTSFILNHKKIKTVYIKQILKYKRGWSPSLLDEDRKGYRASSRVEQRLGCDSLILKSCYLTEL